METFYTLVDFIYNNLARIISNVAVFVTTDIGESVSSIITDSDFWQSILLKLIDVTDFLGIYNMTPLEIMLGIGLPVCLIWSLIKWILPTS